MELLLRRKWYTPTSTIGELLINGALECFTLEDTTRPPGVKVPGKTAIPAGRYRVVIDKSTRFGCMMPHVLDVPNFAGIRIHAGNTAADTEGCILLGEQARPAADMVLNSRVAYRRFYSKLLDWFAGQVLEAPAGIGGTAGKGIVYLTIVDTLTTESRQV